MLSVTAALRAQRRMMEVCCFVATQFSVQVQLFGGQKTFSISNDCPTRQQHPKTLKHCQNVLTHWKTIQGTLVSVRPFYPPGGSSGQHCRSRRLQTRVPLSVSTWRTLPSFSLTRSAIRSATVHSLFSPRHSKLLATCSNRNRSGCFGPVLIYRVWSKLWLP